MFVVMLKRYSFIIISNQAPNFQTGRSAFKPGGERQNEIQTGRTARLIQAGENPVEIYSSKVDVHPTIKQIRQITSKLPGLHIYCT